MKQAEPTKMEVTPATKDGGAPAGQMDAKAFAAAANSRHRTSFAAIQIIVSLATYTILTYVLCTAGLADERLMQEYAQVPVQAYQLPCMCFGTAFLLNFLTLLFERESNKLQLAMLACYINFLAGFADYLSWKGYAPILRDTWGQGLNICRMVMWLHTTPHMVYLLSLISDFSKQRVYLVMSADVMMVVLGMIAHMTTNKFLSIPVYIAAFSTFSYVIRSMWEMFDAPIEESTSDSGKLNLKALRLGTVGLWFAFPATFFLVKAGLVSVVTEEWLWTVGDFLGKVMFSSSLLQGNFLTIEQRRLIAMRIVEESNRIQVIQELRDLVEQKERFMSSMSHELRTPLNGIIGLSDALLVGSCGEINDMALRTITTIKTSGSRLLNLINDILDAASMRKGKLVVKHEKVNLARIVDDVIELCQPLAKRGVQLVNGVPENIPTVVGDTGRIIQIFHNLIGNSCKFTHHGFISVAATHKLDEVEVAVSDTGIGIPEEKFAHIFEAFEQVDMSTTRKYGGTGLGLNLVKQLVEAHEGSISVKSKMGVGTTFFFTFKVWDGANLSGRPSRDGPYGATSASAASHAATVADVRRKMQVPSAGAAPAASAKQQQQAITPPAPHSALHALPRRSIGKYTADNVSGPVTLRDAVCLTDSMKKKDHSRSKTSKPRVLSVDDDPVNQMVIQNLLAPEGYEITQAMDGQEALDILAAMESLPDVILLDVMMPGMSGYDVCRKLRELYPLSCVPVIMISAKSKEEHIVEGLAAGSNDYVVKPFGRQEILARIAAHLRFRDSVYQAGEMATTGPGVRLAGDAPTDLVPYLQVGSKGTSLPASVKAQIEMGKGTSLQAFQSLTLVTVRCANLRELAGVVAVDDLTAALSSLHIYIDDLLEHHQCYMADDPLQDCMAIVAGGLQGEGSQVQADRALSFVQGLLNAVSNIQLPGSRSMRLSVAVHAGAAQGVIYGSTHPVMYLTGQLPQEAAQLLAVCPSGCVHVSAKVHEALEDRSKLVRAASLAGSGTYLMRVGDWATGLTMMSSECESYTASHPHGALVLTAPRLKPVQRALMELSRLNPSLLLELWNAAIAAMKTGSASGGSGGTDGKGGSGQHGASGAHGPRGATGAPSSTNSQTHQAALVTKLQHDKEVLERQLEEVSNEAERLQDMVDRLEAELEVNNKKQEDSEQAAPVPGAAAALEARVRDLEAQLVDSHSEARALRVHAIEVERKLAATQQALANAHESLAVATTVAPLVKGAGVGGMAVAGGRRNTGSVAGGAGGGQGSGSSVTGHVYPGLAMTGLSGAPTGGLTGPDFDALVQRYTANTGAIGAASVGAPGGTTMHTSSSHITSSTPPVQDMAYTRQEAGSVAESGSGDVNMGQLLGHGGMGYFSNPMARPATASSLPAGFRAPVGANSGNNSPATSQRVDMAGLGIKRTASQHSVQLLQQMSGGNGRVAGSTTPGRLPNLPAAAAFDIRVLLTELGMPELATRFEEEEVTPGLLPFMDDTAMRELGVNSVGARLRLRSAAQSLFG